MPNLPQLYRQNKEHILFALFIWAVLLMCTGYCFGDGDQIEILPLVKKLHQTELYKNDLFITENTGNVFNERFAIVHLLSLFYPYLEISCLLLHLLCTVALVLAFVKINESLISKRGLNYLAVFAGLILLLNHSPGSTGFTPPLLDASTIAYPLAAWAVLMATRKQYYWVAVLLLLATFFYPLAGFCIGILVWGSVFIQLYLDKNKTESSKIIIPAILFLVPAIIYIFILGRDNTGVLSSEQYYNIFFRLRDPHHILPQAFSVIDLFILAVLMWFGIKYFRRQSAFFYYFLLLQLVGFILYVIAVMGFHSVTIGNSHWFSTSAWAAMFCVMALFAYADKKVSSDWNTMHVRWLFGTVFSVTGIIILFMPGRFPFHKPCEFNRGIYQNEEILLAETIRESDLNGTFILPFRMTAFKYYAEQSSYVDFKACAGNKKFIKTWYERIHRAYGLDGNSIAGFSMADKADNYYEHMPDDSLKLMANDGLNYMITMQEQHSKYLKPEMHYKDYFVYKLQPDR